MSFLSKFNTGATVKCLITGNDNNSLEFGMFRLDKKVIHDDNTGRKWVVRSAPLQVTIRNILKPGEHVFYLADDDEGQTIRFERLDDGKLRTHLDSRSVNRIINDNKIVELFDSELSKKQLWINLIMGFVVGGLVVGFLMMLVK